MGWALVERFQKTWFAREMTTAVQALGWAERLRAVGLRVTQPRLAVLDVVHTEPHLSADQVAERVWAAIVRCRRRRSTTL